MSDIKTLEAQLEAAKLAEREASEANHEKTECIAATRRAVNAYEKDLESAQAGVKDAQEWVTTTQAHEKETAARLEALKEELAVLEAEATA